MIKHFFFFKYIGMGLWIVVDMLGDRKSIAGPLDRMYHIAAGNRILKFYHNPKSTYNYNVYVKAVNVRLLSEHISFI